MKIISLTVLHYGAQYLASAISTVVNHMDECWFLYTPKGSHGARTDVPCPETEQELYDIARTSAGSRFRWHSGEYAYEGQHRDKIYELVPDADVILTLDADELWPTIPYEDNYPATGKLREVLEEAGSQDKIWSYRWPMIHMWRSLHRGILHDPAYPQRITITKNMGKKKTTIDTLPMPPIVHCGYAQTPPIVEYKWKVHGHIGELRKDVNWFQDKFLANAQSDVHPVGSEYWNVEDVNLLEYLPRWIKYHKFYNMEVIE